MKATIYGYADHNDVEAAIQKRMTDVSSDKKEDMAKLLGEAVFTLLEINEAIPVQNKHRHMIANVLERFADGTLSQDPHTQS